MSQSLFSTRSEIATEPFVTVPPYSDAALETAIAQFFRQSEGAWRSQRRYYTLQNGDVQEVTSYLTVTYLDQGDDQLIELAKAHELDDLNLMTCGVLTTWESHYSVPMKKQATTGSTVFGVKGNLLYRDRGFATSKPVTATFILPNERTLQLRTEYGGSVFEEEVKLVGTQYRTRQTIISRAGEEQMIGQYLENRI
jgi:hypothetical protein